MMQPRTVEYGISGYEKAKEIVLRILKTSQWFAVTPYPDDYWVIKMKEENENFLRTTVGAWGGERVERGEHGPETHQTRSCPDEA